MWFEYINKSFQAIIFNNGAWVYSLHMNVARASVVACGEFYCNLTANAFSSVVWFGTDVFVDSVSG